MLFVLFSIVANGAGDPGSGTITASYNSVSMTEVARSVQAAGSYAQAAVLFVLANPASGTNTVSISTTSSPFAVIGNAASYTGAGGTVDVSTTNSGTGTSLSTSLTPTASGGWTLLAAKVANTDPSASTGSTLFGSLNSNQAFFDSNGTVSSGSPYSMDLTTSASNRFDVVMAAFGPPSAGGAGGPLTRGGSLTHGALIRGGRLAA